MYIIFVNNSRETLNLGVFIMIIESRPSLALMFEEQAPLEQFASELAGENVTFEKEDDMFCDKVTGSNVIWLHFAGETKSVKMLFECVNELFLYLGIYEII